MVSEKRLIDANALMAEVKRTAEITKKRREQFSLRNLIMCIKNASTIDAAEVVHGRWEAYCGGLLKCTVCGYEYTDYLECNNYCGNCGAKMDGDSNG